MSRETLWKRGEVVAARLNLTVADETVPGSRTCLLR
jgi:hypothetical protein